MENITNAKRVRNLTIAELEFTSPTKQDIETALKAHCERHIVTESEFAEISAYLLNYFGLNG